MLDILGTRDCLASGRAEIFILLGNASYSLGYKQQALGYYRRALKMDPENEELKGFVEKLKGGS